VKVFLFALASAVCALSLLQLRCEVCFFFGLWAFGLGWRVCLPPWQIESITNLIIFIHHALSVSLSRLQCCIVNIDGVDNESGRVVCWEAENGQRERETEIYCLLVRLLSLLSYNGSLNLCSMLTHPASHCGLVRATMWSQWDESWTPGKRSTVMWPQKAGQKLLIRFQDDECLPKRER
jgi:hypothetical protein